MLVNTTPAVKNTEPNKFKNFLHLVHNEMNEEELLKSFKAITHQVSNKKVANNTRSLDPSPSSQPTGSKWTFEALAQNIKAALGIDPIHTGAIKDVISLPIKDQITLLGAITERLLGEKAPTNDRNNTFESVMNILGKLGPEYNDLIYIVTQPLLDTFFNDIKKPYINYVGNSFRTADGSDNSPVYPNAGKSGSNYVRSVSSKSLNNTNLPDPKDVFNKLLRRPDGVFNEHKGGVNMMLFYLAIIITHDMFYTDAANPMRNLTTSYLDLSVLYGFTRADQESVRQMENGLLKPDQWWDKRLVIQPAGVAGLLVLFSRNHNYIAKQLLDINENKRFSYGPKERLKTKEDQDEALFQTARLINNGCYINLVIHDYIRTIIGTQADSDFILDPLSTAPEPIYGNAVSIEFNMVYRWHPAVGKDDTAWLDQVMAVLMKAMGQMTKSEDYVPGVDRHLINKGAQSGSMFDRLLVAFNEYFVHASPEELARGLPIAGLHRQEDGHFSDVDIIQILRKGYEQSASEVGNGLNTPASFEHVEINGINQSRALHVCTFNEFRQYLNLTTMKTFEDFSEKVEVQEALKELYGTPDQVELYAGLMVERTKQTGLRLPYTMGRAILSDAVNLLRNDRILVKEMTPANLTNWGYIYTLGDPKSNNRVFPTLLTNLFPEVKPASGGFTQDELRTLFNVPKKTTK